MNIITIPLLALGLILFVFLLLRFRLRRIRYKYQQTLNKYTHSLIQPMADLRRFSRIAPYLLIKSMKIQSAAVMVLARESHSYIVKAGEGEAREVENYSLPEDAVLFQELLTKRKELFLKEIKSLARVGGQVAARYKEISEQMKKLKASLIIPTISESEYFQKPTLLAILCLGPKTGGGTYSAEDIDFLNALAMRATLSIEYAFIFDELKQHQAAIIQSEKLAAIGTTTAGVAHELKNPLTYLSTVAQILPKKWDDESFRKSVNELLPAEVQRMQLIVEGLLNYSRNKELALAQLDVKETIDKAMALLAYDIRKSKVEVKINFDHDKKAKADPNRLMQVFMNLIANAVQAMEEKGGKLLIETKNDQKEIFIFFSDNGPGIADKKAAKIFDPFYTTKEGGTGLGLSICKKIIDEHNGSLSVKSLVGVGTTFLVGLPIID